MIKKGLMIVVYTAYGHTYSFYNVENIKYHNKNLSFKYLGFSGKTQANFNDIVGITKHKDILNPNLSQDQNKELYNKK